MKKKAALAKVAKRPSIAKQILGEFFSFIHVDCKIKYSLLNP